jgi:hypothetical protein
VTYVPIPKATPERPPLDDDNTRVAVQTRLPRDAYDKLVHAATERDLTIDYVLRHLVIEGLDRLRPADQFLVRSGP